MASIIFVRNFSHLHWKCPLSLVENGSGVISMKALQPVKEFHKDVLTVVGVDGSYGVYVGRQPGWLENGNMTLLPTSHNCHCLLLCHNRQ